MGDRDLFFSWGGGEEDGCSADVVSRLKFRTANLLPAMLSGGMIGRREEVAGGQEMREQEGQPRRIRLWEREGATAAIAIESPKRRRAEGQERTKRERKK